MPPLVSVVIPTHDRAPMLRQALRSVLSQRCDMEVIVVDDGSTDGTSTMLAAEPDHRLAVIRHSNAQGVTHARNAGIERATGTLVAFLDDDDLWLPGKLDAQATALQTVDTDWAFGGALVFSPGPRLEGVMLPPMPEVARARMPYGNVVPAGTSNVMVTRRALHELGGFDPSLPAAADWDLWIRLSSLGPPAILDQRIVAARRRHDGNASRATVSMLHGAAALDRRYRALRGGEPLDWAELLHWASSDALRAGDRRTALRISLRSLRRRDPAALKRVMQSLSPVPRRAPIPRPREPINLYERFRPPRVVPWPPGTREELDRLLDAGG